MIQTSSKCGVTTASPEKYNNNNNKQHGKETNKNLWLVFFRYPPKPDEKGVIILNKLHWTRSLLKECLCGYVAKKRKTVNGKRNMNNVLPLQRMQQTSYPSPWPAFQACYCKKRKALQLNYPRVSYHPETKHSNQKSKVGFEKPTIVWLLTTLMHYSLISPSS